jgi:hypothetical protein
MGCDIYSWVEAYNPQTSKWKVVRNAFPADDLAKSLYKTDFVSAPFRDRNYGLFGFLADKRNFAYCEPLAQPRGLPADCDLEGGCAVMNESNGVPDEPIKEVELRDSFNSHSWVLLKELSDFDYERGFLNCRIRRAKDDAETAQETEGIYQTYRELLSQEFFETLQIMKVLDGKPDHVRVVFCFSD